MEKRSLSSVVAANVRSKMDSYGLTQAGLAAAAGVSQKTISNLLSSDGNESRPKSATLESLEKVAVALKIEPWKLLMNLTSEQHQAWGLIEAALNALTPQTTPPTAEAPPYKANGTDRH